MCIKYKDLCHFSQVIVIIRRLKMLKLAFFMPSQSLVEQMGFFFLHMRDHNFKFSTCELNNNLTEQIGKYLCFG